VKIILVKAAIMAFVLSSVSTYAQGTITFRNRVAALGIDARVTFTDGTGVGEGYTAQLFAGPAGTPILELRPVFPTTTFLSHDEQVKGYISGVTVIVPTVQPEHFATAIMRVFDGPSWEESTFRGESNPVTVRTSQELGSFLVGLQPFQVVPEPQAWAVFLSGTGLLLFLRRK
jgi:hypothetical protein